ncbi:murinoglobulin-2-like [Perca fluviatilis]|nr:murinoglobulin-2-like [Perca fluviatilis]
MDMGKMFSNSGTYHSRLTEITHYVVFSRGAIVLQGVERVEVEDKLVNEGEVSFKLTVSPDMAPDVQVVAYAILPSETVIANSADFSTEQCFSHKVSLEFSLSSAVPGEETIMQVTAQPESLCGVSAVDQSVLIKEPGKTLIADKLYIVINRAMQLNADFVDTQL